MREIKLRFFDTRKAIMFTSDDVNSYEVWDCVLDERFKNMQFTGRTDKNGTDIYEGDIILQSGCYTPVEWNDEWGCWELKFSTVPFEVCELTDLDFSDLCDLAVVVGNIHENPELLK
ncbi:MAG: hypothetical protein GY738_21605 [Pseudoalteromonas sp.]|nr:hypothetical protein [Pseudoalteromonas sp.]